MDDILIGFWIRWENKIMSYFYFYFIIFLSFFPSTLSHPPFLFLLCDYELLEVTNPSPGYTVYAQELIVESGN